MITGRCPRCHGNLTLEYDSGWQEDCIQCGFIRPIEMLNSPKNYHGRYDVSVPYTSSPSECTCVAYNVIPYFARQNSLTRELHGRL